MLFRVTRPLRILLLGLALSVAAAPVHAQDLPPAQAAYMKPLGRLATILGSLHYLRKLCGADDANQWRDRMNELMAAQKPSEAERRILTARFNNGYRGFEASYRSCTPAAEVAMQRYLEEGAVLSGQIASRFGN
ncbi:TIGR02301 family protein [Aureimonas fodinaquatilis]|uniref:TIGR02301 family protein n=1 Tax=Aureimonas fodinaquatilis TaxID=2565783 RepID=A0A5B0DX24_9HYPH|nr:TIGR02301 family protein [Aureimonas fodinaquatilis]KAA0971023.1 TIGR02301 family protein [Aureimonas fodinaquatilis]